MTISRSEMPADPTLIKPAPAPPASIEEAIDMISNDTVAEILCEIVASIPDEYPGADHPSSVQARVQRDHGFKLWAEYLQGGPVREILRELMYHFEGFECVEKWETYLMALNT